MKNKTTAVLLALLAASGAAHAQQQKIHQFKDWYIACDNTRRCEAEGYQADVHSGLPVTLYLVREAGQTTPVVASYAVFDPAGDVTGKLTLRVGKTSIGNLAPAGELTTTQVSTLLPSLLDASVLTLSSSKRTWTLSLAGMKAALLKMDDLQGRVGTPGALVRKGDKPESSVLPPLPAPVIKPARIVPDKPGDGKLLQAILKAVRDRSCWEDMPDEENAAAEIHRLSDRKVLVMRTCGRGAYQGWQNLWIANDRPPYDPQAVRLPTAGGSLDDSISEAEYQGGVLSSYAKGRGIGDCIYSASWVWTEQGFKLKEETASSDCRGIPGGGYGMRLWTSK